MGELEKLRTILEQVSGDGIPSTEQLAASTEFLREFAQVFCERARICPRVEMGECPMEQCGTHSEVAAELSRVGRLLDALNRSLSKAAHGKT